MTLTSVYDFPEAALYLYALLVERPSEANISHRRLPTPAEHLAFVQSRPYFAWYIVHEGPTVIGAVYLSKAREIGIFVLREHQGRGWAPKAIAALRKRHPGKCLANVSPENGRSKALFEALGGRLIQQTYELA